MGSHKRRTLKKCSRCGTKRELHEMYCFQRFRRKVWVCVTCHPPTRSYGQAVQEAVNAANRADQAASRAEAAADRVKA